MIREQGGKFWIGNTGKWFGSRVKAEAFLAKGSGGKTTKAPPVLKRSTRSPTPPLSMPPRRPSASDEADAACQRAYNARVEEHERTGWGKNLHKGAFVYGREDIGAMREEFGGEIVDGPRHKGKDVQWQVEFDDGEGGPCDLQWVSAINLLGEFPR